MIKLGVLLFGLVLTGRFLSYIFTKTSKNVLNLFLLVGCLLQIIFSAEGIFANNDYVNHPISEIFQMIAYAIPGILISIICIVPFCHYTLPKPRPKLPMRMHVTIAVYLGLIVRVVLPILTKTN